MLTSLVHVLQAKDPSAPENAWRLPTIEMFCPNGGRCGKDTHIFSSDEWVYCLDERHYQSIFEFICSEEEEDVAKSKPKSVPSLKHLPFIRFKTPLDEYTVGQAIWVVEQANLDSFYIKDKYGIGRGIFYAEHWNPLVYTEDPGWYLYRYHKGHRELIFSSQTLNGFLRGVSKLMAYSDEEYSPCKPLQLQHPFHCGNR